MNHSYDTAIAARYPASNLRVPRTVHFQLRVGRGNGRGARVSLYFKMRLSLRRLPCVSICCSYTSRNTCCVTLFIYNAQKPLKTAWSITAAAHYVIIRQGMYLPRQERR